MKLAIATIRRMTLRRKKEFKHLIRKTGTIVPYHFNRKMHTLVYNLDDNKISEAQMNTLKCPYGVVFVTFEQLVSYIRSGLIPQELKNRIAEYSTATVGRDDQSKDVAKLSAENCEASIEYHTKEKPLTKSLLKKKKLSELKELAIANDISLEHKGRLTKQVIIARLIADKVEKEQQF